MAISDGKGRKASEWEFSNGKPNGKSIWYFPSGKVRREIVYKEGEIDGEAIEWSLEGKIIQRDKYINGRRLAIQTDWYAPGREAPKVGRFLHATSPSRTTTGGMASPRSQSRAKMESINGTANGPGGTRMARSRWKGGTLRTNR